MEGLIAVGRPDNPVAIEGEVQPDQLPQIRFVVDDQHCCHTECPHGSGPDERPMHGGNICRISGKRLTGR